MNKDSYYYKNKLKERLQSFTYDIDEMYSTLEDKLRSEIIQKQEEKKIKNEEADEVFNKLNYPACNKILKHKLPLMVRLFNKYKCMGYAVTSYGDIELEFVFNDRFGERYSILLSLYEVKKYLS